jgi:two-component system, OmpR family, sensor histidine kinase VicK
MSNLRYKCESCTDCTAPSVAIEVFRKPMEDAKSRGISFRYLTEITPSNVGYCKRLSKLAELRHLDQIKGNFSIFDDKVYLASTIVKEAQPVAQLIYSNVKTIVEQQQYLFETLWNRAIPAEQKVREIEEGRVAEKTEVLHGPEKTTKAILEFLSNTHSSLDICADSSWPSVAMEVDVYRNALRDLRVRRVKFRIVTEITKDNLSYCKEVRKLGELRHLDGVKGSLGISEKEYTASATLREATLLQQVIYSNVKEIVEQQQYLFEGFWNRAIPAETKIKEIEEGVILGDTEVIQVPLKIQQLFIHLVKSAKEEILLILPTINAFYREERLGIIRLLKESTIERNIGVRALTPINEIIEQKVRSMMVLAVDQGKNLDIRPVHLTLEGVTLTTVTILVIDRKESLVIEKIDDSKEDFIDATGSATYSNSKPTVLSYISIFESLWQQAELYEQVKESNEKLEKANENLLATERAKEEFISMISHELKTPIVPLKGYAQMLLRPKFMGAINEKQKKAISSMLRNIEKLQALVDDVMDVYKLDLGRIKFSKSYTDITHLINQTIAELRPLTLAKQIDLKAEIRSDVQVFCDSDRIEQVLSNLIKNSIDFVPDKANGEITVRVERDNNNNVTFTVEDNGIGIKPEKADKLFQKFYQIDTGATRRHGGTGLGLVICRGIVDAHGGKIWVDKTYKNGATIKFTLADKEKEEEVGK